MLQYLGTFTQSNLSLIFTKTLLFSHKTTYFSNDSYDSYKNADGNSKIYIGAVQKVRQRRRGEGVFKNSDKLWHGRRGMIKWWRHHSIFLKCWHLIHMKLSSLRSTPTCTLAKVTEVVSGVWQRVKQSYGDKRSIYNGENTIDNLFCSFITNDDANIALYQLVIEMKTLHCVVLLSKWKTCTYMSLLKSEVV